MAQTPRFPDVTVLLGDPRLPDVTKVGGVYSAEDLDSVVRVKEALAQLPGYRFEYLDDHTTLVSRLLESPPDFVLNLCDTGFRNDAARELELPALLQLLRVPYTGAGPEAMVLCYDKALVRGLAAAHGIPVPEERFVHAGELASARPDRYPALLKPNRADGSVGLTQEGVVHTPEEAARALEGIARDWPGRDVLIQEFLPGTEYGLALIGNPGQGLDPLPLLEVDYDGLDPGLPRILGYESKTIPSSPYWTQIRFREARLDPGTRESLVRHARVLFERLRLRDYARFDFRTDARGEIKLLEVNANPAWCWDGKLNFMAGFAGLSYPELLGRLLEAAQVRAAAEAATGS